MPTVNKFLPDDEQKTYDSVVDGLRRQGWSKSDAEAEAIARIDAARERPIPLGEGTVTIHHEDGIQETLHGTWSKVFRP